METKYNHIFNITNDKAFTTIALNVFNQQFKNNKTYRSFCDLINVHPSDVKTLIDIPFLPIQFFKSRQVLSTSSPVETVFTSSGTTGTQTSKHFVTDLSIYETSFNKAFNHFYGDITNYTVLALLPSYLERKGSSLIYMTEALIKASKKPKSGFYLNNLDDLTKTLLQLEKQNSKILLIGVSFALLDLIEHTTFTLKNTIVMETGGMKGKRKELTRPELHEKLMKGFGVNKIHSEYGMTELLSQAYSQGQGVFKCPPWMKVLTRAVNDPLKTTLHSKTGGLNIIDLANVNSCAFIATQDLGKTFANTTFEVIGRFDNSDIRGCNLMSL